MKRPDTYFDLSDQTVKRLFKDVSAVWEMIQFLPTILQELLDDRRIIQGTVMPGATVADGPLYIGPGSVIEPGAYISEAAYIGENVHIRHGAYVRRDCVFLPGSLLGHASEAKTSLFLPGAKAPHFAYVGDSILGHRVNLGAGTKISNLRITSSDGRSIRLNLAGEIVDTGLRKLGAILGDDVEVGCNAVFNPGVLMARGCSVYPGAVVGKGFYDANTMIKLRQQHDAGKRIDQSEVSIGR